MLLRVGHHCYEKILLVRLLRDALVRVGHHGYKHVEEDHDVADGVAAEHEQGPEPRELLTNQ